MTLSCTKKLSALLRGITSKHYCNFYYLNCLHDFRTKTNLNSIKKYVKIKIFLVQLCLLKINVKKTNVKNLIKQHLLFMQILNLSLIKTIDGSKNNPENSSKTKVGKHIPSGFSMFTIS